MSRSGKVSPPRIAVQATVVSAALCSLLWVGWLAASAVSLGLSKRELSSEGITPEGVEIYYRGIPHSDCAVPPIEWIRSRAPAAHQLVWQAVPDLLPRLRQIDPGAVPSLPMGERAVLEETLRGDLFSGLLGAMREAAHCPVARFARDYSMGPFADPGPMPEVASLVRLAAAQAVMITGQEGSARSADVLEVCSRMARFGTNDSILPGWLSGVSIDKAVMDAAQMVLSSNQDGFDPRHWRDLASSWGMKESTAAQSLASVVETELIHSSRWGMEGMLSGATPPAQLSEVLGGTPGEWRARSLAYRSILLPLALADASEYLEYGARLRSRLLALDPRPLPAPRHPVSSRLSRWSRDLPHCLVAHVARLRLAQVGVALEVHRSTHGAYPESLADLGLPWGRTVDPFTGKSFLYRSGRRGVLVYSVGANGSDEGGRSRLRASGDIAWRVERPPFTPMVSSVQ